METMAKKRARPRRSFTPEFKAEIVQLCRQGTDRSVRSRRRSTAAPSAVRATWPGPVRCYRSPGPPTSLTPPHVRWRQPSPARGRRPAGAVRHHHRASKGRNGAPRIHADLADEGRRHGRKRIARLMREHDIVGKHRRRGRHTTIPDPAAGVRPDLVGRAFTVDPNQVNTRWCGDITYIRTWPGLALSGHSHRPRLPTRGRLAGHRPPAHRPGQERATPGRDPAPPTGRGDLPLR
jgi:hypothetical protein